MSRPVSEMVDYMEIMPPPPPPLDEEEDDFVPPPPGLRSLKVSPPPGMKSYRKVPPPPPPAREEPVPPPPRDVPPPPFPEDIVDDDEVEEETKRKSSKRWSRRSGSRKTTPVVGKSTMKDKLTNLYKKKIEQGPSAEPAQDGYEEPKPLNKAGKEQVLERELGSMKDEAKVKLMKNVIGQLQLKLVDKSDSPARKGSSTTSKRSSSARKQSSLGEDYGTCTKCSKTIEEESHFFLPDGSKWHLRCVECHDCGSSGPIQFFLVNNKLYCERSFNKLFDRQCAICHEKADPTEPLIDTCGEHFHIDCFQCKTCEKVLAKVAGNSLLTSAFHFDKRTGLFCTAHYHAHTCYGCGEGIALDEKNSLQARLAAGEEPKTFHGKCFCCSVCDKSITELGGGYVAHQGNIYCAKDYAEAMQMYCSGCSKQISAESKYLKAFDTEKYHVECFKCSRCNKRKDGMSLQDDGTIVCEACS